MSRRWSLRRRGPVLALLGAAACSEVALGSRSTGPTLSFEPRDGDAGVAPAPGAATAAPQGSSLIPAEPIAGAQPDGGADPFFFASDPPEPEPLTLRDHWRYELRYRHGTVTVARVTPLRFERPVAIPRTLGRFAVELWIGRELIDRVRFDFPLLAADHSTDHRQHGGAAPSFDPGADVTVTVIVPASDRARRAELIDRQRKTRTSLPWPPSPSEGSSASPNPRPLTAPVAPSAPRPNASPPVTSSPPPSSARPTPARSVHADPPLTPQPRKAAPPASSHPSAAADGASARAGPETPAPPFRIRTSPTRPQGTAQTATPRPRAAPPPNPGPRAAPPPAPKSRKARGAPKTAPAGTHGRLSTPTVGPPSGR